MAQKPNHIEETFWRKPPDYDMRRRYRPEDFRKLIDKPLIDTYDAWTHNSTDMSTFSARVNTESPNPFGYYIVQHRNKVVGGRSDWKDITLGDFHGPWQLHFEELAAEYWKATDEGMCCHIITQSIGGVERCYHRLILPRGLEILVASVEVPRTVQ